MINQLFKEKPSEELAARLVRSFGLSGLGDSSWFSNDTMEKHNTVQRVNSYIASDLEQLYLKCKARSYLHNIDERGALTILRQILRVYNYNVIPQSKCKKGRRFFQYRIIQST